MIKYFVCILLFSLSGVSLAQEEFRAILKRDNLVFVETSLGLYRFSAFGQHGVDVHFSQDVNIFDRNSLTTLPVQADFLNTTQTDDALLLDRGALKVQIQKRPFGINFLFENQSILQQEPRLEESDSVFWTFTIAENEILYGGGARALGMNRRGNRLELYNRAHYGYEERSELMNFSMPIVLGSSGFLLHFDNTSKGYLDLDSEDQNQIHYKAVSGEKRYQVIASHDNYALLRDYTALTGRQTPPPLWALGNFASRFGYRSAREVLDVVEKYEKAQVPLDAVILDLYWFGKTIQGTMGNLAFDLDSFPNPKQFLQTLLDKNIQPIVITEPFILTSSSRWQEALDRDILCKDSTGQVHIYDFYFGNTGLIDVFKPEAQAWFWEIYSELHALGVRGIWGDLGEPEVHPAAIIHHGGLRADDIHNAYGHQWAKLIFEGYQRDFPNERLFNLMRAGAPGSQRYGMIPWSGDVNRTWGGLKSQPEIALQMSLQGMAYMHSDLGGFAGDYDDAELYIRWLQYGVFQPIFRPHAQEEVPSEPVLKDAETLRITKNAINLRYALLPYNYNLVLENAIHGTPLMRPLFFETALDSVAAVCSDTYFWGRDFLISPVLEKDAKTKMVTVPPMSTWIDFYTNQTLENREVYSRNVEVAVHINSIPTYVRAGAIIPMIEPVQNTSQYQPEKIIWKFFLHHDIKSASTTVKHDNLLPLNHANYQTWETICSYEIKRRRVRINFVDDHGKPVNMYNHSVQFAGKWKRYKVWVNGKRVKLT